MALAEILQHQRRYIASLPDIDANLPMSDRSFLNAIINSAYRPAVIAELKPKSPSQGQLAQTHYQPVKQAEAYAQGGAVALSVLTEASYFGGQLADLSAARAATSLPVLCKDFILSPKQVKLAREAGADAVLLIVAALEKGDLQQLKQQIEHYQMLAVIEVHNQTELEMALSVNPQVILINNRNLWDLSMHPGTTEKLLPLIPQSIAVISASGFDNETAVKALPSRVNAVLIGTHLMQQGNPRHFIQAIARPV